MELLEDDISTLSDKLLDRLLTQERADAAAGLANPLPIRVITERVIGFRDPDVARTQRWVFGGSRMMGGRLPLDEMAAVGEEVGGMLPWLAGQLKAALASPGRGDVLSAAAAGVRDGVMSREEATFTLMVLVGAGGETTTSLIGNAIRILAERPGLQDAVRADPDLVPALVEEVLRFESPFRFHPRTARGAAELGGVEIPNGAMVMLLWVPRTATRRCSSSRTPSFSTDRMRRFISASDVGSITASVRRWRGSRLGSCSRGSSDEPRTFSWILIARRAGRTTCGRVDTNVCRWFCTRRERRCRAPGLETAGSSDGSKRQRQAVAK